MQANQTEASPKQTNVMQSKKPKQIKNRLNQINQSKPKQTKVPN